MAPVMPELQAVFQRVFGRHDLVITDSTAAVDVDGWDSMTHVNLLIAIEKHFGVEFTMAEIGTLGGADQNVGNLVRLLVEKTGRVEGDHA